MRNFYLKSVYTLILFSFSVFGLAQMPNAINSLTVIPANPTINDEVNVVVQTIFPSGGCALNSSQFSVSGTTHQLNLEYNLGMLAYICSSTDTISLGMLPAGNHHLNVSLIYNPTTIPQGWGSVDFTVTGSLSNPNYDENKFFKTYPNPVLNDLTIEFNSKLSSKSIIEMYSILGQKINLNAQIVTNLVILETTNLSSGIYILVITDKKNKKYIQKIIKQ